MDWGADPGAMPEPGRPAPDELLEAARSAVATLCADDVSRLDAESLGARVAGVESLLGMLGAHQVECVAAAEARGDARGAGFRSTQAWLRVAVRLAPGAAKGLVVLARRIGERAATADALAAGRISVSHAKVLAHAMEELAPCFDDAAEADKLETELVDLAERVDPLRLADACRRLRIRIAPDRAVVDDWVAFQRRDLSISRGFDGLGVINGTLDPLGAETVMSAIHAFAAPSGDGDPRTPGQRRADALTEICRRVMTLSDTPIVAGERPHVNVIVPIDVLDERIRANPSLGAAAQPGELAAPYRRVDQVEARWHGRARPGRAPRPPRRRPHRPRAVIPAAGWVDCSRLRSVSTSSHRKVSRPASSWIFSRLARSIRA